MRSLLSLAVLLGATADGCCVPGAVPCVPALHGSGTQTGNAPGSFWVKFFFKPGTEAFAINAGEVWTFDYSASPSARTKISGGGGGGSYTAGDLSTTSLQLITMTGGVMTAGASDIYVMATDFMWKLGTTSPYTTSAALAGFGGSPGCVDGTTAARFNSASAMTFANPAESLLLVANYGCHTIATVDVATPCGGNPLGCQKYTVTTVLGTLSSGSASTDGFGSSAALINPRSLVHWKDRFYLTSDAGVRISVIKPQGGWWVGKVAGASTPGRTTTTNVAFTGFGIQVSATGGISQQLTVWSDCSLVAWQDSDVYGHIIDPDADMTYLITMPPTTMTAAYFAQQDPLGNVWVADQAGGIKRRVLGGCSGTISPNVCKWPTASGTLPLPLPQTRTMTRPATSAASSAAASTVGTVAAATNAATTSAAATTTTTAAGTTSAATTSAAATTTTAAASTATAGSTTAAAATTSTTAAASSSTSSNSASTGNDGAIAGRASVAPAAASDESTLPWIILTFLFMFLFLLLLIVVLIYWFGIREKPKKEVKVIPPVDTNNDGAPVETSPAQHHPNPLISSQPEMDTNADGEGGGTVIQPGATGENADAVGEGGTEATPTKADPQAFDDVAEAQEGDALTSVVQVEKSE